MLETRKPKIDALVLLLKLTSKTSFLVKTEAYPFSKIYSF